MGVSSSIVADSFSYGGRNIVGGYDVDVGGGGIFPSVGWHTKLAVAQRSGGREKKVRK